MLKLAKHTVGVLDLSENDRMGHNSYPLTLYLHSFIFYDCVIVGCIFAVKTKYYTY